MTDENQAPNSPEVLNVGDAVSGTVTDMNIYGAMVDIGTGEDALLHISQLDRSDFRNISDVMNVGDSIDAFILKVDRDSGRAVLTYRKPPKLPIATIRQGNIYKGTVTRIENFGAFVDIGSERPGMVHVSEMSDGFVQSPSDVLSVGDEVEVRVIKVNSSKRQIDLSMKSEEVMAGPVVEETDEEVPTAMAEAFRRAMGDSDQEESPAKLRAKAKARRTESQDDILSRTLQQHSNS